MLIPTDDLLYVVLDYLPLEYQQLKVFYTAHREEQGIDELISVCVQEEHRLSEKRVDKARLTMIAPSKKCNNNRKKLRFHKKNNHGNN